MQNDLSRQLGERDNRLLTPEELGQLLGISPRMALLLPIKQIRLGKRTIRFILRDVYEYLDLEDPNRLDHDSGY
jgi:hypothetical protein